MLSEIVEDFETLTSSVVSCVTVTADEGLQSYGGKGTLDITVSFSTFEEVKIEKGFSFISRNPYYENQRSKYCFVGFVSNTPTFVLVWAA